MAIVLNPNRKRNKMTGYTIEQVAIQLFTLRDQCKTLPDLVSTLRQVREMGYQAVQVSGIGNVTYPDIRKALDDEGLICCATHESGELILKNPGEVSERLHLLGCRDTAFPYPGGIDFTDQEAVRRLAENLDASGAVLAKNGQTLSYHNHAIEFLRLGHSTALDFIYETTNPAHLKAELDTYWVQYGGGDPVAWCEKLSGRMTCLHLKDYAFTGEGKPAFAEIGSGNLDWRRILRAAHDSGCRWLIVEQDICPGDPFVSIRKSFEYLKNLLNS
jgi:sugar phosphate isomerase/epimerase